MEYLSSILMVTYGITPLHHVFFLLGEILIPPKLTWLAGKSPFLIGDMSSIACCSIVMLVFGGVPKERRAFCILTWDTKMVWKGGILKWYYPDFHLQIEGKVWMLSQNLTCPFNFRRFGILPPPSSNTLSEKNTKGRCLAQQSHAVGLHSTGIN